MPRRKNAGALIGAFGEGPRSPKPIAAVYRFQLIAETGPVFTAFGEGGPSLSVNGTAGKIGFVGELSSGETGVFCGDKESLTPVASTAGGSGLETKFTAIRPVVSVNGLGTVMFAATGPSEPDAGLYVGDGGTVSRVYHAPPATGTGIPFQASDFGLILSAEAGEGGFVIADATDGHLKRVYPFAGSDEPFHTTVFYGPAALNNAGMSAFYAAGSDGVSFGIFTGAGRTPTPVATHEKFSQLGPCVAISSASAVAFSGTPLDGSGQGIFVGVKGKYRTVAEVTDRLFAGFGSDTGPVAVGIDEGGNVAFLARLVGGGAGIYTGPAASDRVIGTGDALFGSVVTELRFSAQAMDAGGNIAFGATLDDGRSVIAVAMVPQSKTTGETVVSSMKVNAPRVRKGRSKPPETPSL